MSKADLRQCIVDSFKALHESFEEANSSDITEERFDFITEEVSHLVDEIRESSGKLRDDAIEAYQKKLADSSDSVEHILKAKLFSEVDQDIKINTMFSAAFKGISTPKQFQKAWDDLFMGRGASLTQTKTAIEKGINGVISKTISGEPDAAVSTLAQSYWKMLNPKIIRTEKAGKLYNNILNSLFRLSHSKGDVKTIADLFPNSVDARAVEIIHKAIKAVNDTIYKMKNDAGLFLGYKEDYLWPRIYSKVEISGLGKDGFVNLMVDTVDRSSFLGSILTDDFKYENFFKDMYDRVLLENVHTEVDISRGQVGSLIKSFSRQRKLVFKDADAEFRVFRAFNPSKDVGANINRHIYKSASQISSGLMFGYDLHSGILKLKNLASNLVESGRFGEGKAEAMQLLEGKMRGVANTTKDVITSNPESNVGTFGQVWTFMKNWQFVKLAKTALVQVPYDLINMSLVVSADRGITAGALHFIKKSADFSMLLKHAKGLKGSSDVARALGVMPNLHMSQSLNRMVVAEAGQMSAKTSGRLEVINEKSLLMGGKMLDYTGLSWANTRSSMLAGMDASRTLHKLVTGYKNGSLNKSFQLVMKDARLSKKDMDLLVNKFDFITDMEGVLPQNNEFLNIERIHMLPDELFSANKGIASMRRRELVNRIRAFMDSRIRLASPAPTLRQKVRRGVQSDTDTTRFFDMVFAFKNTILDMSDGYFRHIFPRMLETQGPLGAGVMTARLLTEGFAMMSIIDVIQSAILDEQPALDMIADGDVEKGILKIMFRLSWIPVYSDLGIKMFESFGKFGETPFSDVGMGPVFSTLRDIWFALGAQDKPNSFMTWFVDNIVPKPWYVQGILRNILDIDLRESVKRGQFRERSERKEFTLKHVLD